jgi:hypothetical protein
MAAGWVLEGGLLVVGDIEAGVFALACVPQWRVAATTDG